MSENERDIREYISHTLDQRINIIVENKLERWFQANIRGLVDEAIKEAFKKVMLVKFE